MGVERRRARRPRDRGGRGRQEVILRQKQAQLPAGRARRFWTMARRQTLEFFICISPWLIGLVVFTAGPMLAAVWLSLVDWKLITPPVWVGLDNYRKLLGDDFFLKALANTAYYTGTSVSVRLLLAFVLAWLLNVKIFGQAAFRTIFFVPSILSGVAVALMFIWVFHPNIGLLNRGLAVIGIPGPAWLTSPRWAMPALIIQSLWSGVGGPMVIYLAGLQGIPQSLYEAAEVDGANWWTRVRYITIPLMSSVIFLTVVMGMIGSFQVFTSSYIMTRGGPNYSTLTVVLYLYIKAFEHFSMGYAAAMAWGLFFIIVGLTYLQFRWSRRWVYYEAPGEGRR